MPHHKEETEVLILYPQPQKTETGIHPTCGIGLRKQWSIYKNGAIAPGFDWQA